MKKINLICLMLLFSFNAPAQGELNFESLKLNSSPAFVILGVEPVNIQRPNSPTDFIAGIQSSIVNNELTPNFSMETSPYYWFHPKNEIEDSARFDALSYVSTSTKPLELLTLSLASSAADTFTFGSLQQGTGFGLGLHTTLFSEGLRAKTKKYMIQLLSNQKTYDFLAGLTTVIRADPGKSIILDDFLIEQNANKPEELRLSEKGLAQLKSLLSEDGIIDTSDLGKIDQIINEHMVDAGRILNTINQEKFPLTKEGFSLDVAVAFAGVFQQNELNKFQYAKTSIWITPSYRWFNLSDLKQYFDLMAVVRFTFNDKAIDESHYFESGLRGQATFNKWSISLEGVMRLLTAKPENVQKNTTWRTDLSIDYKLSSSVTFKFTFGSNFDGNATHFSDPQKMFALGGFNFGFGNLFR
jgi:hypothetical protein